MLLYSHDSWGLGHLRRSLSIAEAIAEYFSESNVLVVTGSPCATQFELPDRCDVLKLPAVSKDLGGEYIPRTLAGGLAETIELRSRLITESYKAFDPHAIIVDHQLTGLKDEALTMLQLASAAGKHLIYGMRDVLDSPGVVESAWDNNQHRWALEHAFDQICVYGAAEVFDPRRQYGVLDGLQDKVVFTGYITPPLNTVQRQAIPSIRKNVVVTMGGGQDGEERIEQYLDALASSEVHWNSHIITGPLMDRIAVRRFKRRILKQGWVDRVRITRFYADMMNLLQNADAVVSMAGYNSCAEILKAGIPAVLMPRVHPRKEQLIRARRFSDLGLARCVTSQEPHILRQELTGALDCKPDLSRLPDLSGRESVCDVIDSLLQATRDRQTAFTGPTRAAVE
ncbi:MAG: hypothetical protein HKO64_00995 [Xanthomonadales bacterium]|nr:hypothetical protein [Xanthomonadales bacterium]NNL94174.1 hypothetical protein [Xanthomonadales bacterium]